MRDHQETVKYESSYKDELRFIHQKSGWSFVYSEHDFGTVGFPVLLKGRDDAKSGPSPYPTNYFGFRFQVEPIIGHYDSYISRYTFYPNGWYDARRQKWALNHLNWSTLLGSKFSYFVDGADIGFTPNVSAETRGRAIKSANSKLRSDSINIGQTIGEMPEAIHEFSKLVTGVAKTLLALRKGQLRKAQVHLSTAIGRKRALDSVQGISNTYLFYKFGVAPILNDVNNMASEIRKALSAPDFIKVKGTATQRVNPPDYGWDWVSTGELLEVCEVGYSVRPKPYYAAAFLGVTNPLATAWEVVPLSFIINWFVSIGDVLNALDAGVGLDFVSGYQTNIVKGRFSNLYTPSDSSLWDIKPEYKVHAHAMERIVLSAPLIPPLHLKMKRGLGSGQLTTIAALLMSSVKTGNVEGMSVKDFLTPSLRRLK